MKLALFLFIWNAVGLTGYGCVWAMIHMHDVPSPEQNEKNRQWLQQQK